MPSGCAKGIQIKVTTLNVTSWGTFKNWLRSATDPGHVLAAQETKLLAAEVDQAAAWLMARGWRGLFAPAVPTEAGGRSGGTALLARDDIGIAELDNPTRVDGRLVMGNVHLPGAPIMVLGSVYLQPGLGIAGSNASVLARAGAAISQEGLPWAIAGDFNCSPNDVGNSNWAEVCQGSVVASGPSRPTCVTPGAATVIDYFVADRALLAAATHLNVDSLSFLSPHQPVSLVFELNGTDLTYPALFKFRSLPPSPVLGPRPPEACFREASKHAGRAQALDLTRGLGQRCGDVSRAVKQLGKAIEKKLRDLVGEEEGSTLFKPPHFKRQRLVKLSGALHKEHVCHLARLRANKLQSALNLVHRAQQAAAWQDNGDLQLPAITAMPTDGGSHGDEFDAVMNLARHAFDAYATLRGGVGADDAARDRASEGLAAAHDELQQAAEVAGAAAKAAETADWSAWVATATSSGGKAAHRFSKPAAKWAAPVPKRAAHDGSFSFDPAAELSAEAAKLADAWQAKGHSGRGPAVDEEAFAQLLERARQESLQPITAEMVTNAGADFALGTATSHDAMRMKHFSHFRQHGAAAVLNAIEHVVAWSGPQIRS